MQPPRRLRRQRRGFTQKQLNDWLDEQERIIRERALPNEIVEEFDPLYNPRGQLHQIYERAQHAVEEGRRTILFRFNSNLEIRVVKHVKTRFMLKISTTVELRNMVDGKKLSFYQTLGTSPWLETLTASQNWVKQQEELRLENQRRPNTQWAYEKTLMLYVKVILDRQPLFIGLGRLPDWLRNKPGVVSLDTFRDNLCLFRCIAVHLGAHVRDNIRRIRELAEAFFAQRPGLRNRLTDKHLPLLESHFKQGIAAYKVQPNGDFVLTHLPANYDKVGRPVMTIGVYEGHAFLIRDIKQVTQNYTCGDCQARFTKSVTWFVTQAVALAGKPKSTAPTNASEPLHQLTSEPFIRTTVAVSLEQNGSSRRQSIIHHARCGHGGERYIFNVPVDGYHPETNTVFQYYGCYWHGCKKCYETPDERKEVLRRDKQGKAITSKVAYGLTLMRAKQLRDAGYTVVEKWEHEAPAPWTTTRCPEKQTETYPHAIVYDFESYQDKTKAACPTRDLSYESEHVPISVSIADTLNTEPEYIVAKDPNELIHLFYQSLERRHAAIVADVEKRYFPPDPEGIPTTQGNVIMNWINQVPVVGFNSGHYDLKLIRKYFVPVMTQDRGIFAAEKNGRIMFINTPKFKFLDVMNYLAPGITYDKWVKTYGATLSKSWLPYEWFDSPDKLDYPRLPPYFAWYSQLKGAYVLSPKEYDGCKRIFQERGMKTFSDWLEYYNNLDVAPFLEALQKMKEFYTTLGVDIFKDAVSLSGVSKQYILRKTLKGCKGYKPPELYAPNKEAYDMLKAAVVGGPSLVFTRKHVAGETKVRSHQYEDAKPTKRILGYDANSLYPSTMMKEMPCGEGVVTTYNKPEAAARVFPAMLSSGEWFGFAEVDIEVPEELWPEFEEFPPLFINRSVPDNLVPQHMHDYLRNSGRKRFPDQKKLLGVLSAKKILLYAPLLQWYLDNGLKLTAVYRTIDYKPQKIFEWFVNEVADNRRKGDADKEKALLAEVFKLLGNSVYSKFIEGVERQKRTLYTRDEGEVDKHLRSAWFDDLEEIGDAYKIEMRKNKITIDRPFQIGIVVYQLAKLRMLQFYYEFLDYYIDRRDFELIQMDTDSMYFALSHDKFEDAIKPGYQPQFEEDKKSWLAWDKWSNREPGLFKLEKQGTREIALCSKCYYVEDETSGGAKMSSKGVNKRQNELRWERYERALEGSRDMATNRGFRMQNGAMYTYEQRKLGLSAYYDKRWVLPDGIHTEPLELHIPN